MAVPSLAPKALLAGLAMFCASGCSADYRSYAASDGVPLKELDMSGDPPARIGLASADRVVITAGDVLAIEPEGTKDAVARLRFERDGDALNISRERGDWTDGPPATVRITIPPPRAIALSGSGHLQTDRVARETEISIAGSGRIDAPMIDAESLAVSIAGSGHVDAGGSARRLRIAMPGSGQADLRNLRTEDASVSISGSGDAAFHSDGTVAAKIAGSGDVMVTGNARCTSSVAGSGKLTCTP